MVVGDQIALHLAGDADHVGLHGALHLAGGRHDDIALQVDLAFYGALDLDHALSAEPAGDNQVLGDDGAAPGLGELGDVGAFPLVMIGLGFHGGGGLGLSSKKSHFIHLVCKSEVSIP